MVGVLARGFLCLMIPLHTFASHSFILDIGNRNELGVDMEVVDDHICESSILFYVFLSITEIPK